MVNQPKFPGELADGGESPQRSVSNLPLLQHQPSKGQEDKEVSHQTSHHPCYPRELQRPLRLSAPPHPAS